MDSINYAKGYGKVNADHLEAHEEEDQAPPQSPHPKTHKKPLLAISALLLLSLLIGLAFAALVRDSTIESAESPSISSTNSAESTLRAICNVTQYPDSCFSSMIPILSNHPEEESDTEAIFKLSIQVAIAEVSRLSNSLKGMIGDHPEEAALSDCGDQMEDALSRLNESASAVVEAVVEEEKMRDVVTWISAAETEEVTCVDGLEEMGSEAVDVVKKMMQRPMEYTSNVLAIAANFKTILHNLHLPLH